MNPPLIGPLPLSFGRPTRTLLSPSSLGLSPVPSWSLPVKGRLTLAEESNGREVPDSLVALSSSSQEPSWKSSYSSAILLPPSQ